MTGGSGIKHQEGVSMLVVRPIAMSDYDALHTCAVESGHGFTSLPVNEELLTNRITHSEYSFSKPEVTEPGDEGYLMVIGVMRLRQKPP